MRTFLLVFDDGSGPDLNLQDFVERLDDGAQIYSMDGHVCFIKSNLSVPDLTDKFLQFAGSNLFFVTGISSADYSGRMVGTFWDFMKDKLLASAA